MSVINTYLNEKEVERAHEINEEFKYKQKVYETKPLKRFNEEASVFGLLRMK